jgi:glutathione synthase/RimK-type ligase-like ATP-grasp enzyme
MLKLLITTAGGSGVYPSIEAVKSSKYDIDLILVDASEIAGALYEVEKSYIVPFVSNERFFDVLLRIMDKEKVEYFLSFLDEELNFLADKVEVLKERGIKTMIPKKEALLHSWNKILTYKKLKKYMPPTQILDESTDLQTVWERFDGKVLMKPAESRGGRGIVIPEDFEEFSFFCRRFLKKKRAYLVQKLIVGKEYNVTSFHDTDGKLIYAAARWKFEKRFVKSGSKASVIVENDEVVDFCLKILQEMDLEYGFNNVEVIQNEEGIFLLEVNAFNAEASSFFAACAR